MGVLSLNADYEARWMLREIDEGASFDTEEVQTPMEFLTKTRRTTWKRRSSSTSELSPRWNQMSMFGEVSARSGAKKMATTDESLTGKVPC
jgi:hypothetical protein